MTLPADQFTYLTPPAVSAVSTLAAANSVFTVNDTVPITVAFTEPVYVTGTPQITLNDGGVAYYTGGSGASTLTFTYTVAAGQSSSDLDYSSTGGRYSQRRQHPGRIERGRCIDLATHRNGWVGGE